MDREFLLQEIVPEIVEAYVLAVSNKNTIFDGPEPKYKPMNLRDDPVVLLPVPTGYVEDYGLRTLELKDVQELLPFVKSYRLISEVEGVSLNIGTEDEPEEYNTGHQFVMRFECYAAGDFLTGNVKDAVQI